MPSWVSAKAEFDTDQESPIRIPLQDSGLKIGVVRVKTQGQELAKLNPAQGMASWVSPKADFDADSKSSIRISLQALRLKIGLGPQAALKTLSHCAPRYKYVLHCTLCQAYNEN